MSSRDITLYIVDIFIAIDKIERYTLGFDDANTLLHNEVYWDATIRELEIIGEATKYLLSDELLDKNYRRIVDFRNQITHGYFGIDADIIWSVLKDKLPIYKSDLLGIIIEKKIHLDTAITYAKEEFKTQKNTLYTLNELSKTLQDK